MRDMAQTRMRVDEVWGWKIYLGDTYAIVVSPRGRWRFVIARNEHIILPPFVPIEVVDMLQFYGFKGVKRRCRKREEGWKEVFPNVCA